MKYLFILLIGFSNPIFGQNYNKEDRHARKMDYRGESIHELALALTSPFIEEVSKVRAIYTWITDNIAYDCKKRNSDRGTFITYESEEELVQKKKQLEYDDALTTLISRKGVCYDYTYLFKQLCAELGIPSEVVLGKVKKSESEIGERFNPYTHTWNAVKIKDKWYFIDATWGSGYTDGSCTKFTKEFRDYFLCTPQEMIYTHYPDDSKWQLLPRDKVVTESEFLNYPLLNHHQRTIALESLVPKSGILPRTNAKTHIKLNTKDAEQNFILVANNELLDAEISRNAGVFTFSFFIPDDVDFIRICFEESPGEYTQCIVYKVK